MTVNEFMTRLCLVALVPIDERRRGIHEDLQSLVASERELATTAERKRCAAILQARIKRMSGGTGFSARLSLTNCRCEILHTSPGAKT